MTHYRVRGELMTRRLMQNERAVEKYGDAAGLPGGDPSREIVDYLANELVGLRRYAEMIVYRMDQSDDISDDLMGRVLGIMIDVMLIGDQLAATVIELRQDLECQDLLDGEPETPLNVLGESTEDEDV